MRLSDDEESVNDTSGGLALPKPSGGGTIYGGSSKSTATESVARTTTSYLAGKTGLSSYTNYSSDTPSAPMQAGGFNRNGYSATYKSFPSPSIAGTSSSGWAKPKSIKHDIVPDAARNQDKAHRELVKSKQRLAPEDDVHVEDSGSENDSPPHASSTSASGVTSQGHGQSGHSQSSVNYDSDDYP